MADYPKTHIQKRWKAWDSELETWLICKAFSWKIILPATLKSEMFIITGSANELRFFDTILMKFLETQKVEDRILLPHLLEIL